MNRFSWKGTLALKFFLRKKLIPTPCPRSGATQVFAKLIYDVCEYTSEALSLVDKFSKFGYTRTGNSLHEDYFIC